MSDAITNLADFIAAGVPGKTEAGPESPSPAVTATQLLEDLFGGRYHRRFAAQAAARDTISARVDVPFAGLINPNNPPSGTYGGASVIWFPTEEHGSLLTFVIGTGGLSPDEGLLTRPGHQRRVRSLWRMLTGEGIWAWAKPDAAALGVSVPAFVSRQLGEFKKVLDRYGSELYLIARVPTDDEEKARRITQAFFDLYAYERGWLPLKKHEGEFAGLISDLRADTFPPVKEDEVYHLLKDRRFVILQGPPGTGKTRMAEKIKQHNFSGRGMTVQFHPAVTYEDFIIGLSPDTGAGSLHFDVRPGWLLEAAAAAEGAPYLLVIDEINRADLGKVLGEAIYLFEPKTDEDRSIHLPYAGDGRTNEFRLPENLYILGTMNTADRSIAPLDIAIRRRFAFASLPPNPRVIEENSVGAAVHVFSALQDVFTEYASDEALQLLPGQSFFLAATEDELRRRFAHELIPLLDEYLREGLVAPFAPELVAVKDQIESFIHHGVWVG